jgi:transposase-like protein
LRHCKGYTLAETPTRWKCSGCGRKFSVTSGTIFHSGKLSIRDYLAVIALFCNGVKGVAALESRYYTNERGTRTRRELR